MTFDPKDVARVRRLLAKALWLHPDALAGAIYVHDREERRDHAAACLWQIGADVDAIAQVLGLPHALAAERVARAIRTTTETDRQLRGVTLARWGDLARAEEAAFPGDRLIPEAWTRVVQDPHPASTPTVGPSGGRSRLTSGRGKDDEDPVKSPLPLAGEG